MNTQNFPKFYYVYILFSEKDGNLYVGFTPDLYRRFSKHVAGYVRATKYRRPLRLIYAEAYISETDARKREVYLKGGKGRSEMKIQLAKTFGEVNYGCRF